MTGSSWLHPDGGVGWVAGLGVAGRSRDLEFHFAFSWKHFKQRKVKENILRKPVKAKKLALDGGVEGTAPGVRSGRDSSEYRRRKGRAVPTVRRVWGVLGDSRPRLVSQSRLVYLETQSLLVFPTYKAEQ